MTRSQQLRATTTLTLTEDEHRERCADDQRMRWWKDGHFCAAGVAGAGVGVSFSSDWDPWLCAGIGGVVLGAIDGLGSLLCVTVGGFRD